MSASEFILATDVALSSHKYRPATKNKREYKKRREAENGDLRFRATNRETVG